METNAFKEAPEAAVDKNIVVAKETKVVGTMLPKSKRDATAILEDAEGRQL